jgi:CheY-like chemotaxis protein
MDAAKSRSDREPGGMRILVVDDSRDTARMMGVLLRGQGYEVMVAFKGREAIGLAETFRPDVILLDISLPDMSGEEVAQELRKVVGLETTTVVAISGYGPERVPPVFHGQFVKPVNHDALNGFLARLASERRKRRDEGMVRASPAGN